MSEKNTDGLYTKITGGQRIGKILVNNISQFNSSNTTSKIFSERRNKICLIYGYYVFIRNGDLTDYFYSQGELIDAGFESGHAYGKALRTVKSCVGTTWCRYGVGDSVSRKCLVFGLQRM